VRALKIAAMILLIFPGSCVAYYGYWDYQWANAKRLANQFCGSVTTGAPISDATARAKRDGRRFTDGMRDGEQNVVITFTGPTFNAVTCELKAIDGRIASAQVVEQPD
jgi:hypothetical protein